MVSLAESRWLVYLSCYFALAWSCYLKDGTSSEPTAESQGFQNSKSFRQVQDSREPVYNCGKSIPLLKRAELYEEFLIKLDG